MIKDFHVLTKHRFFENLRNCGSISDCTVFVQCTGVLVAYLTFEQCKGVLYEGQTIYQGHGCFCFEARRSVGWNWMKFGASNSWILIFFPWARKWGSERAKEWVQRTLGWMTMKSTRKVLGHSLLRSLIRSHRSLIRLLRTARFARALRCTHSFARSLTRSLRSSWESDLCL